MKFSLCTQPGGDGDLRQPETLPEKEMGSRAWGVISGVVIQSFILLIAHS